MSGRMEPGENRRRPREVEHGDEGNPAFPGGYRFTLDQDDPESLCQPPSPTLSNYELSAANRYYGVGEIFGRYAELPTGKALAFGADHYVPWIDGEVHDYDLETGLPAFLAINESRAHSYAEKGMPRPVVAGAVFNYLKALPESRELLAGLSGRPRQGTIAFPHKSTIGKDRSFDFESFALSLKALPDDFQPVVVCIYWRDYLEGRHLAYERLGIPVITCGHIDDSRFLFRFLEMGSQFRFACANATGSSYPLSVSCGCTFFLREAGPIREIQEEDSRVELIHRSGEKAKTGRALRELAGFPPSTANSEAQRQFVHRLMGEGQRLSPEEIREIDDWSRRCLLERQDSELVFTRGPSLAELNAWLPDQVSIDGWARAESSVRLAGGRSVDLWVQVLGRPTSENPRTLQIGSGASCTTWEISQGYYHFRLPLESGGNQSLHIRASEESPLSEIDGRLAAFRLLAIQRQDSVAESATGDQVSWEELPERIQSPPESDR